MRYGVFYLSSEYIQYTRFTHNTSPYYCSHCLWIGAHNTSENNYIHISPPAVLWFVFYFMFFFVSTFFVSFLLSLTVLIVCRFFPHTYPIASTKPRVCFYSRVFSLRFSLLLFQSFIHSSFRSFFLSFFLPTVQSGRLD